MHWRKNWQVQKRLTTVGVAEVGKNSDSLRIISMRPNGEGQHLSLAYGNQLKFAAIDMARLR
ncbi:MAG: hypothetical protein ACI9R3_001557 [Verrucomicrobiales bacterium]|jgi:hypothetical protein